MTDAGKGGLTSGHKSEFKRVLNIMKVLGVAKPPGAKGKWGYVGGGIKVYGSYGHVDDVRNFSRKS